MFRRIKNVGHLLEAILANLVYGFPSKKVTVLAITGTDGKTTTSTLLYHILHSAEKKVALISTVAAFIGNDAIDTGFHVTNPSPFALQKLLARTAREGMEFVVLEMTSHGIDQYRNWGITPLMAGITNVTHEHLDYHGSFQVYLETKARLLLQAGHAFLNADAKGSYDKLRSIMKQESHPYTNVTAKGLPASILRASRKRFGQEAYNAENVALATGMAKRLGIDDGTIAKAILSFPGVKGRMEEVISTREKLVVVDFAHTPNALEQALHSMRERMKKEKRTGKLIVVFGCAGLRDVTKRPMMGKIAGDLSDIAVFTAEDPRSEDIWTIINQMKSGVVGGHDKIVSVPDRYEAIRFALTKLAKNGDVVLITGKGHERSMNINGTEYDWSDQEAVTKVTEGKESF